MLNLELERNNRVRVVLTAYEELAEGEKALFRLAAEIGQDRGQDRTGQDRTGQDRTGQDRTGQDRTGQDRTGQDRTGQDRTGQDRTGQDRTGQDRCNHRTQATVNQRRE